MILGGCGILLLTKVGGVLFDRWSAGAPFYIMAMLNCVAVFAAAGVMLVERRGGRIKLEESIQPGEEDGLLENANHQGNGTT